MRMDLPRSVLRAIEMLEASGNEAYAVGGCVRDWTLGMIPHDYDVCTSAPPDAMKKVFAGERTVETGLRHGTLTVLLDGMPIEITTFRQDGEYLDGRHPQTVLFTRRVEDDLSRRDFTVNAMAYSPARGLIDPFGGREDCARGLIRCVGEAEKRFAEDALRILRALRFAARLGFAIEKSTAEAVHAGKDSLRRISRERIAAEMDGLLLGAHVGEILRAYPDVIAAALDSAETPAAGLRIDWLLAADRVDAAEQDAALRWAALLADAAAPEAVLEGLRQPKRLIRQAAEWIACLNAWRGKSFADVPLQERLARLGPEGLRGYIALAAADRTARFHDQADAVAREAAGAREALDKLLRDGTCYSLAQLAVNGAELARLGYRGPAIGEELNRLLLRVVRGEIPNDKEALLEQAKNGPTR